MDPRTPVLVGAGQVSRPDDPELGPLALMERAARAAVTDAGAGGERLLGQLGVVAAVECFSWPVPDPAAALAQALGVQPRATWISARGGNGPIALLAELCIAIQAGELDVALLAGGETMTPFISAMRHGTLTGWPDQEPGTAPSRMIGHERTANHPAEEAAGLIAPITFYPLIEHALRASTGAAVDAHRAHVAELWARFAAVAVRNPHAWTTDAPDAETIATPVPANRMAAHPYTKLMTANIQVDQGAALLLCSAKAAQDAGVARERWVFPLATAAAHDHWHVTERHELHRSPALEACGRAALGHTGAAIDDVGHLDIYSCFPSAVQVAATELGIDLDSDPRPPTVTGGLTFAGGPVNNYVTHSLATLNGVLRADSGGMALATGVGWYLTKHAVAVLSSEPPRQPFGHSDMQAQVDALPAREVAGDVTATAAIEAYTAVYDRDGAPAIGSITAVLDDERRAVAKVDEPELLRALVAGDPLGLVATLDRGRCTAIGQ